MHLCIARLFERRIAEQDGVESAQDLGAVIVGPADRVGMFELAVFRIVTLDLQPSYAPIPADTLAIVRQKTLLGEAYVELSPGDRAGPKLPDGGTIPRAQVESTQQLDQVLATFDRPTQRNFEALLEGTSVALAGRGQDLNDALGNLRLGVIPAEISAGRLVRQDVVKRCAGGEVGRQIQQFAEPEVPSDQPSLAVEHAQAFPDIFERALKQQVPALQPQFVALQVCSGELLALQGANPAPSKGRRSH